MDKSIMPSNQGSNYLINNNELANYVLEYFERKTPKPETELVYENSYQLAVAVALSAQCTDKRVNAVTPAFFNQYPSPQELAIASQPEVYSFIKSISYPNNKAKNLIAMAKMIVEKFNNELPRTIEELEKLPGVGRKTANVLASVLFDVPAMAVDTHVFRVSNRIGLIEATNPLQAEKQLVAIIPEEKISRAHHWLILHGRYTCKARNPDCTHCGLTNVCHYYSTGIEDLQSDDSKDIKYLSSDNDYQSDSDFGMSDLNDSLDSQE